MPIFYSENKSVSKVIENDEPIVPVSVVIPCYHHVESIERAVASVAMQSMKVIECIIVNDGGGEPADRVLSKLQYRYGKNWLIIESLQSNVGAGGARNIGWDRAHGTYIAFLDADDAWHPRKIEIQYGYMSGHPEVSLCGHRHRQEVSKPQWWNYSLTERYTNVKLASLLFSNKFITPSAMVKRDLNVRFSANQRYMEDFRLWLTIAIQGKCIVMLEDELACIYKPKFGQSGLSADLVNMELGELRTYLAICLENPIILPLLIFLFPYSLAKFLRRLLLVMVKRI